LEPVIAKKEHSLAKQLGHAKNVTLIVQHVWIRHINALAVGPMKTWFSRQTHIYVNVLLISHGMNAPRNVSQLSTHAPAMNLLIPTIVMHVQLVTRLVLPALELTEETAFPVLLKWFQGILAQLPNSSVLVQMVSSTILVTHQSHLLLLNVTTVTHHVQHVKVIQLNV
jgi:hypothetical protein